MSLKKNRASSRSAGRPGNWARASGGSALLGAAVLGVAVLGCDRDLPLAEPTPPPTPALAPATPDRLPPGRLLEGSHRLFGFPVPRDLEINAAFVDWGSARGKASTADLIDYVKDRVAVQHVEMVEGRVIFPNVKLKGGDGRLLRIELLEHDDGNELLLRDLTTTPATPGLSEEQRWQKAGMTPNGTLIDQQNLE